MTVLPFAPHLFSVTPALRRAAEYRAGTRLSDRAVVALVEREWESLLTQWTALGEWLMRLETGEASAARPALSGIAINNPSEDVRAQQSATMKAVWAAKRANGQRLPRAVSREFGQRVAWRTLEQKAHQSEAQRDSWARRKAKEA